MKSAAAVLRRSFPEGIHTRVGSMTELPFEDGFFDGAYATESLEHAVEIAKAVSEICRVVKLGGRIAIIDKNAECWGRLIPDILTDHCALESFSRGTLVVVVDSSPHLYELKQLLLSGLQKQLLIACKSAGLRKITLKAGRWYTGDGADRRITFC